MEGRRTRAKADGKQRCLESRVHICNSRGEAHDCLLTSQGLPSYKGSSFDCARPEGEAGSPTSRESARRRGSEVTQRGSAFDIQSGLPLLMLLEHYAHITMFFQSPQVAIATLVATFPERSKSFVLNKFVEGVLGRGRCLVRSRARRKLSRPLRSCATTISLSTCSAQGA